MTLLFDLIDLAHRHDLVRAVSLEPDGCDLYELRTAEPVSLRIRPDGRFSKAIADGEFLSLGQVMNRLLAEVDSLVSSAVPHGDGVLGEPLVVAVHEVVLHVLGEPAGLGGPPD